LREQGFAPCESNLVDAELGKHVHQFANFFEGEEVFAGKPDILLFWHAILAAQVAAICNRQPQIAEGSAKGVGDEPLISGVYHKYLYPSNASLRHEWCRAEVKAQMRNAAQSVDERRVVIHLIIYPSGEWV
jgi:hypothetical protein